MRTTENKASGARAEGQGTEKRSDSSTPCPSALTPYRHLRQTAVTAATLLVVPVVREN